MQRESMLFRTLLILTAALVLAALQARTGAAQSCLQVSTGPGPGPVNSTCSLGSYSVTFTGATDSIFPGGQIFTIKLTAGVVSLAPKPGDGQTNPVPVKVTTTYVPAGAGSERPAGSMAIDASQMATFTVSITSAGTVVTVASSSASGIVVPASGSWPQMSILPGCTITFSSGGSVSPTSCP